MALLEYPLSYESFCCVGAPCEDSCCEGWDIEVDDVSYYRYMVLPGEYGKSVRARCEDEADGTHAFRVRKDGRCPFLQDDRRCEMILRIGEDFLCETCMEFPRYYNGQDPYYQMDLSLSCPEACRMFFFDPAPEVFVRRDVGSLGGPLYRAVEPQLAFGPKRDPEDYRISAHDGGLTDQQLMKSQKIACSAADWLDGQALLQDAADGQAGKRFRRILRERDEMLKMLSDPMLSFEECFFRLRPDRPYKVDNETILQMAEQFESLDLSWEQEILKLKQNINSIKKDDISALYKDTELSGFYKKLAAYLVFRYALDAFYQENSASDDCPEEKFLIADSMTMVQKGLHLLLLLCAAEKKTAGGIFDRDGLSRTAHLFSKEVEHSERNIHLLLQT